MCALCASFYSRACFRIGAHVLTNNTDAQEVGLAYAELASIFISIMALVSKDKVSERFGRMEDRCFAIIDIGKLGSEELNSSSNLDIIVVHDVDDPKATSNSDYRICIFAILCASFPVTYLCIDNTDDGRKAL